MELETNRFPKTEIFPRLSRLVHFLFDHIRSEGLSDHANPGGPALDRELCDKAERLQLDFEAQSYRGF